MDLRASSPPSLPSFEVVALPRLPTWLATLASQVGSVFDDDDDYGDINNPAMPPSGRSDVTGRAGAGTHPESDATRDKLGIRASSPRRQGPFQDDDGRTGGIDTRRCWLVLCWRRHDVTALAALASVRLKFPSLVSF